MTSVLLLTVTNRILADELPLALLVSPSLCRALVTLIRVADDALGEPIIVGRHRVTLCTYADNPVFSILHYHITVDAEFMWRTERYLASLRRRPVDRTSYSQTKTSPGRGLAFHRGTAFLIPRRNVQS